jgi:AraC-like DNA-binding protein
LRTSHGPSDTVSESAFSNAFSRATGLSPGRFRKEAMQTYSERRRSVKRRELEAE